MTARRDLATVGGATLFAGLFLVVGCTSDTSSSTASTTTVATATPSKPAVTSAQAEEIARKAAPGITAGSGTRVLNIEPGEVDGKPTWNVRVEAIGSKQQVGETPDRTVPVRETRAVVIDRATGQVLENEVEYPR